MDIQTKICPRCKIDKSAECYSKNKSQKYGLEAHCKDCKKQIRKQYYQENLEKERERNKQYRQNNPEKIKEYYKQYRQENPEKVREIKKQFYQENPEKVREYGKRYYQENKEKVSERKKKWRQENAEKERERLKKYRQENPEKVRKRLKKYKQENKKKIREKQKKYFQERRKTDPKFKLDQNISAYIRITLKSKGLSKKEIGWQKAVGYTVEQLKEHLEKQFDDKMTWENHGTYWHIDHIKPKSLFEYDSIDHPEFKKCWSLDNLQPLEAIENLKKSNKYSEEGK